MMPRLPLLLAGILMLCTPRPGAAQLTPSEKYKVQITFTHPSPTCTITGDEDLRFRAVTRPDSPVTLNLGSGDIRRYGRAHIEGAHVTKFTVSVTFPSKLDLTGAMSYTFSGNWRESDRNFFSSSSPVSGSSFTKGSIGGLAAAFEHYFWFGGTVTGPVSRTTPKGTYSGIITITAGCS